jgi:hypothetical protein
MSAVGRDAVAVPGDSVYEWKAVLLLSLTLGFVGLDRWIVAPLAAALIVESEPFRGLKLQ